MAKVDLEHLRRLREAANAGLEAYIDNVAKIHAEGVFCQYCGEKDPPNGFYPMSGWAKDDLSPYHCNDCDKETRRKYGSVAERSKAPSC